MFASTLSDDLSDLQHEVPQAIRASDAEMEAPIHHNSEPNTAMDETASAPHTQPGGTEDAATAPVADGGDSDGTAREFSDEQKAVQEEHRVRWENAVKESIQQDILTMRTHLGEDVKESVLRELWVLSQGDPVEAIAMHLDPAYKESYKSRCAAALQEQESHIKDVQSGKLHVDAQTAIHRLRMLSNAKDVQMNQIVAQNKARQAHNSAVASTPGAKDVPVSSETSQH